MNHWQARSSIRYVPRERWYDRIYWRTFVLISVFAALAVASSLLWAK